MGKLGFGMMRLPLKSDDPTDFDYDELNEMVDAFLEAGFTYFDTSMAYHAGHSEEAARKAIVERHPRDSFTIATKFPTFNLVPEDKIEETFHSQLANLGVDYIDYYLIHDIQTAFYEGVADEEGIIPATHLFEHAKGWREQGLIKHLGISFHAPAHVLDKLLTEHPEVEFVQLAINPIDWDSEFVQAAKCYEVVRCHGLPVIGMEMVKGGGLSILPEEAEALLRSYRPDDSISSWSLQFSLDLENTIAILSGMSNMEQMQDNIKTATANKRLSKEEKLALWHAMDIYRNSAPITPDMIKSFEGLTWNGVPTTAILQAYSICQIQPSPGFSDDNNYFRGVLAENGIDSHGEVPHPPTILADGTDESELVNKAADWLLENSFF